MMKQYRGSFGVKAHCLLAIVAAIICTIANSVLGQTANQPQDLTLREHQMSALEREKTRKRSPQEVLAEVNEDLNRLRVLNEGISAQAVAPDQQRNYKSIVENVTEIKKRSARLSIDLALPEKEREAKRTDAKEAERGALQPELAALNKLLDSFLSNPIFSDTGAIDLQLAAKARRDLDDIIARSDMLRKNAQKRGKDSVKAP
jgi:hypothetical protein